MNARRTLLALCVAAASAASVAPAGALADVVVRFGPPPPRYEVVPIVRPGWVWVPGYWNWNGRRYVWVNGHRVHARRGYHWAPDRWVDRDGRWYRERGRWDRD